jgi:hypothetical protein
VGSVTDLISIVDADPDLAGLLDEYEREQARREALTRERRLSAGDWAAANSIEPDMHHRGFLIIDGLVSREVDVLGRRCVELLGHGDVLRPGAGMPTAPTSMPRWGGWSSNPRGWPCSTTASWCA